jgi:RHS repeat-associated protein
MDCDPGVGNFELAPGQGHRVVLSDDAAGSWVIADAVRFVRDTARRAVLADAVRFAAPQSPDFTAPSSALAREYVYLGGRPLALIEAGAVHWIHTDHLGTPQKLTDAAGQVVWDAVLRPFGEAHALTGPAELNLRFPGQLHDPETGFHYNYFRDYDPVIGRYLQSDPIGLSGGLNTYAYAEANPVVWIDPEGLATKSRRRGVPPRTWEMLEGGPYFGPPKTLGPKLLPRPPERLLLPNYAPTVRGLPPRGVQPPAKNCRVGPASRPSERAKGGQSLWDEDGGEWRYYPGDKYHNPHWDYNPHDAPNSPWQNVPLNDMPVLK